MLLVVVREGLSGVAYGFGDSEERTRSSILNLSFLHSSVCLLHVCPYQPNQPTSLSTNSLTHLSHRSGVKIGDAVEGEGDGYRGVQGPHSVHRRLNLVPYVAIASLHRTGQRVGQAKDEGEGVGARKYGGAIVVVCGV